MKTFNLLKKHILLVLLYITALVDVCYTQPLIIRSLLLVLLIVIMFSDDFVFSLPLILMLNDGLGTAIGNYVSFYWIAVILILAKKILKKELSISSKAAIFFVFGLLYVTFLFFVQYDMSFRTPLVTFSYFLIVTYIIEQVERGRTSLESIILAFGCAVTIAAIHMAFFGGVDYTVLGHEGDNGEWERTTRYGIVGAGSGDPNYSGLRLLFGLVCLWSSNIKRILKTFLSIIFVYCIIMTVSLTTLLVFLLLVFFGLFIQRGLNKKIKILIGVMLGALLLYALIVVFPIGDILEQISLYYYRLQSKMNFLSTGDINEFTTGRSYNAITNLEYALDRDFIKSLFGFDSIPMPGTQLSHNTYVDAVVHFGIIGAIVYIGAIIKDIIKAIRNRYVFHTTNSNLILCLKFLYAVFSFALSINYGIEVVLLFWVLLFI